MKTSRIWLIMGVAGLLAATGGYLLGAHLKPAEGAPRATVALTFQLPDLAGHTRTLSDWHGRPTIVNFWATWCPPCRLEIPLLKKAWMAHHTNHGLEIVGIAVDNASDVRAFSHQMGIPYPVLLGEASAINLMQAAGDGDGLLPYSVVYNAQGQVVATQIGAFTAASLSHDIALAQGGSQAPTPAP